jgi:hypothetical protein
LISPTTSGKKADDLGWVECAWEFKAVDEETTLEFYTVTKTDPYAGAYIDNVRVGVVAGEK